MNKTYYVLIAMDLLEEADKNETFVDWHNLDGDIYLVPFHQAKIIYSLKLMERVKETLTENHPNMDFTIIKIDSTLSSLTS